VHTTIIAPSAGTSSSTGFDAISGSFSDSSSTSSGTPQRSEACHR
jgi:hypothetical protein